jgi:uncharacterized protein
VHSFIETFMGEAFEPLHPNPDQIWIEDIAHSLSLQCRFNGHTKEFYSVAEHCVRVSWLLEDWEEPTEVQLWGLLHDASEAYLTDIPSPLKQLPAFEAYRAAEEAVMWTVCNRFGLPWEEPEAVRFADQSMLATEARDLMPYVPEHWQSLEGMAEASIRITPWEPREAKRKFLNRFCELRVQ